MALAQLKFKEGDTVKVRGTARSAKIVKIITDINDVQWHRNRPHFIMLVLPDFSEIIASPHQLRTRLR